MRVLLVLVLLITFFETQAVADSTSRVLSTNGGQLALTFYRGNLRDAALTLEGTSQQDLQYDTATLEILPGGGMNFRATDGYFTQLENGYLPLEKGIRIIAKDLLLESSHLHIKPMEFTRDTLLLTDQQDVDWFYLDYGHYERLGQILYARYLDVRIGRALAEQLNDLSLVGHIVGFATLETNINVGADGPLGIEDACPVAAPNWPTQNGSDADVAMLKLPIVSQIAREDGKVALAPSAYFENIGNADIPWFAQFADSRDVDACCADQGNGLCAPYGNDQGGMLVYALYRFVDGHLEQLGQSQVKHAFNSVNMDTSDGSLPCRAANHSGRVVPSGCEDLYQAGTNANQSFLGPREEVIAHSATWLRDGSIWDQDGPAGEPDGNCDFMPTNPTFGGQVPCLAPVADVMDRRLSVFEHELEIPTARYFIEAWYLARDDVNVLNSFGRKEVKPTFTTAWTFPELAPFQQGPVIEEHIVLQATDAVSRISSVESNEGQLRISTTVTSLDETRWQYDISVMNLDFDRAIKTLEIPIPETADLSLTAFFDGDVHSGNDWLATTPPGIISFQAPENVSLKWGSLVSFRFVVDRAPVPVNATLGVAGAGSPVSLSAGTLGADDSIFDDGFE